MTDRRICAYEECSESFIPKRPHQRFHDDSCRYAQWELDKAREEAQASAQRVERHVLDEVRGLLEEHKGDWTLIVREYARGTLLATGHLSAADFTILGVPVEHCNLPGAQIGAYAAAGYMEAVTFRRWSAEQKASRKSGKYWVYRITHKGKEKLSPPTGSEGEIAASGASRLALAPGREQSPVGMSAGAGEPGPSDGPCVHPGGASSGGSQVSGKREQGCPSPSSSAASGSPDQRIDAGRGTGKSDPGVADSSDAAGVDAQLLTLEGGHRGASSMYDPMEDAAA